MMNSFEIVAIPIDERLRISIIHSTATRVSIGEKERDNTNNHPFVLSRAEMTQVRSIKGYIVIR